MIPQAGCPCWLGKTSLILVPGISHHVPGEIAQGVSSARNGEEAVMKAATVRINVKGPTKRWARVFTAN
jgi:hypothetical protein